MLRQRVITAVALLAVLLPALWSASPLPFALFAFVLTVAGSWEWGRLSGLDDHSSAVYAAALAVPLLAVLLLHPMGAANGAAQSPEFERFIKVAWPALSVGWVLLCLHLMPRGPQAWRGIPRAIRLILGWVVMASTWAALTGAHRAGVNFLLSTMCVVWVSDISAYFAGHRWGRRKLAPTISPGKTWEGVMGACVGVLLLAVGWMAVEQSIDLGGASVFQRSTQSWGPIGLVVVVAALVALGIVGDLFESLIKRAAGVKDSSGLLPGHGGVLDRVDALLPVMPAAMALLVLASSTMNTVPGAK